MQPLNFSPKLSNDEIISNFIARINELNNKIKEDKSRVVRLETSEDYNDHRIRRHLLNTIRFNELTLAVNEYLYRRLYGQ
jgi:hypothetical protein